MAISGYSPSLQSALQVGQRSEFSVLRAHTWTSGAHSVSVLGLRGICSGSEGLGVGWLPFLAHFPPVKGRQETQGPRPLGGCLVSRPGSARRPKENPSLPLSGLQWPRLRGSLSAFPPAFHFPCHLHLPGCQARFAVRHLCHGGPGGWTAAAERGELHAGVGCANVQLQEAGGG